MPLRRFSTAELVLTQRAQLEWPLLLMVLLGAGGFALAEASQFYLAVVGAGVVANALALSWRSEIYVPRLAVNIFVLLATGVFLIEFGGHAEPINILAHYLTLILLAKLFEQKRNRDYAQMVALSLVLTVAGAIVTKGLWFALLLIVYIPVACYVVMLLALKLALDRQASAVLAVESRPIDPQRIAWNVSATYPRRLLWRKSLTASTLCLLVGMLVFLMMPRTSQGLLVPLGVPQPFTMTGFSGTIRLNDLGRITPDQRVVMRARLTCDGQDLGRQGFPAYLRGKVYARYGPSGEWFPLGDRGLHSFAPPAGSGRLIEQRITLLEPERTIFALAPAVGIDLPYGVSTSWVDPEIQFSAVKPPDVLEYKVYSWAVPLGPGELRQLAARDGHGPTTQPARWRGRPATWPATADVAEESYPPPDERAMAPQWWDRIRQLARQWCSDLPPRPPATGDFQGDLARDQALDLAIAQRISDRLHREYSYTLDLSDLNPDRDPVEDFLFHTKHGHCEFFASAMTLLCQALGVQARLAGGYLADEHDADGLYTIRASDAHAWCEVFTPGADWATFDPTPGGATRGADGSFGRLRDLWRQAGFAWRAHVINYSEEDRQRFFGWFLRAFDATWKGVFRTLRNAFVSLWRLAAHGEITGNVVGTVVAVATTLGLVALALLLRRLVRRQLRGRWYLDVPRSAPGFYQRLARALQRRGLRRRADQTVREFLRDSARALALPDGPVAQVTDLCDRIRWGGQTPAPPALAAAEETVDQLIEALSHRAALPT